MTKDTKGVRQVLEDLFEEAQGLESADLYANVRIKEEKKAQKQALATLQEIMLGMLPEELGVAEDGIHTWDEKYEAGYNSALNTIKQNIRGGFNNG